MKCKRLVIRNFDAPDRPTVLYGIVQEQKDGFLVFRTGAGKTYEVSESLILLITDTNLEFQDNLAEGEP